MLVLGMKVLAAAFIIALIFSAVASTLQLGTVQAATSVTGIITSDITWTKANSPYNLTGNVLIDSGVTVAVEADAVVNLNGYYIRVNGTLIIQPGVTINMGTMGTSVGAIQVNGAMTARGTSAHPIHFNGAAYYWDSIFVPPTLSSISFADSSLAWNEQTGSGCIIENTVIDKTGIQTSNSIKISNNQISGAGIGVMKGSPVISNNVLSSSISIGGGSPIIANNQLNGGYISLYDSYGIDSPIITSNVISNPNPQWPSATSADISVVGGSFHNNNGLVLIEKNILTNSLSGIELVENENQDIRKPITIRYNTIINNEIGISITDRFSPTITNNNIYNNNASIKLSSYASRDVNAANNWWGTTDTSIIDSLIYDFNDDFNLGKVNYTPFLTSANTEAYPDPSAPIPTPTPEQTPATSPTPTPDQTPTPTPSQEPQQTELTLIVGVAIAVAVFGAGLGVLIYLIKRK
jgi:parallel beta-helix repeat protein